MGFGHLPYHKLGAAKAEKRAVKPYNLSDVGGGWYVIGYDTDRAALRTFALQRMKAVRVSTKGFLRPDDFNAENYLGESFGIWRTGAATDKPQRVRIRLDGWAARVAAERRWHPSQEIKQGSVKTESVEILFELANFEEIIRWVLNWGGQAEVLAPKALRERVAEKIQRAARKYAR